MSFSGYPIACGASVYTSKQTSTLGKRVVRIGHARTQPGDKKTNPNQRSSQCAYTELRPLKHTPPSQFVKFQPTNQPTNHDHEDPVA